MSLLPGQRLGPYEIVSPLGAGGMGEVWRGRDTRLGREVAVKVLPQDLARDPDRLRRFEQEARAASALNHPNILVLFDVGTEAGTPYLITELLEGESLRRILEAQQGVPLRKALDWAAQIARGLAAAHERGIVHRDLKPANVLVTRDGRVKILDFGLAKLQQPGALSEDEETRTRQAATEPGIALGTMGYMAPEQVRGQAADHRGDLFALGCILYELLTGKRAFQRESRADTMSAILRDDPPELGSDASGRQVPPSVERLMRHCLEKNPEARFQSASDLAFDLDAIALESATVSRPAEWAPAAPPAANRRLLVAAVVALAVLGAILSSVLLLRTQTPAPTVGASIAVLPFVDLSPDRDQEYFADGLAEELLGVLAKVPQLRVVGRTSSFAFKGRNEDLRTIGQKLDVATVLEGSVRKSGDRLRITAQLVNIADGFHLWSETYDRTLTDVFAVQDEIAGAVVEALKVQLLPGERPASAQQRTANPEAYNQFLLGRYLASRGGVDDARLSLEAYEKAVTLDSTFAGAYAALALAQLNLAEETGASAAELAEGQRRAQESADRALALDPDDALGYQVRGSMRRRLSWDWAGALTDFERALALDPGESGIHRNLGYVLGNLGRLPEGIAAAKKATELDPLSPQAWKGLGDLLQFDGQLAAARLAYQRNLEIRPQEPRGRYHLGNLSLLEGKAGEALTDFEGTTLEVFRLTGTAMARHDLGQSEASQRALEALIAKYAHNAAYQVAAVYAWRGERDLAFEWLDRAYAQHDSGMPLLKADPLLAKLREDARYVALLRRMNLPA